MKELITGDEIRKYIAFLFFDTNGNSIPAQIFLRVLQEKTNSEMKGTIVSSLGPNMTSLDLNLPLTSNIWGDSVDIDVCFYVDEPLYFRVSNFFLTKDKPMLKAIVDQGIKQAGGTITSNEQVQGYVKFKAKNQNKPTFFRVTQLKEHFQVHKLSIKNKEHSWELMDIKSPRIKGIINIFKTQLTNDSLQTDLSKLLNDE